MINDPELKAMSEVYDALQSLDVATQKRVVDWVLAKLLSPSTSNSTGAKRAPKPSSKRRRKRGHKLEITTVTKTPGAKRGPKPKSKRGSKPGTGGRPKGSVKKPSSGRRGRPRKNPIPTS
ncbi:MAG TPA: hypothetical protein VFG10_09735 [Saprospiraceae bacterium]|nr:hypothetical protein [Saprospiraceae bacterium]